MLTLKGGSRHLEFKTRRPFIPFFVHFSHRCTEQDVIEQKKEMPWRVSGWVGTEQGCPICNL